MSSISSDKTHAEAPEKLPAPSLSSKTCSVNENKQLPYSPFTSRMKVAIVTIAAVTALVSPLSANMYYPSIQEVRDDLHTTQSGITWTITSYMIAMAIFPLVWSNLADQIGRKPVYAISMLIYTAGSIGCALSKSLTALIISRVIQSAGASAVQGAGAGTISDIYPREQRGTALGIYYLGPLLGPCIGPLIGGYVGQDVGWRWVFWILAIWGGVMCLLATFVLPETHRRLVSLKHKIQQVNIPPPLNIRTNNPIVDLALVRFPAVALIMFYFAMLFGTYFTNSTGNPLAFQNIYGLSQGISGICFLPLGVGNLVGSITGGRTTDLLLRLYKQRTVEHSGDDFTSSMIPAEARLKLSWVGSLIFLAGVIMCGWFIDYHLPLAAVLVSQFLIGFGLAFTFQTLGGYLIDVFPHMAARITGVQNFWRSIWTAILVQLMPTMLDGVGWGWTYTIMFFLALAGALCVQLVAMRGESMRTKFGPF